VLRQKMLGPELPLVAGSLDNIGAVVLRGDHVGALVVAALEDLEHVATLDVGER
jgi:hypothetical protein